ncbi:rhodanese-like domain-containing protein [Thalassospira mesophila]|uniref:Sulfurtransferase n=1 Tax=Thalassospira mesophila TaxID=1293891 RepID=A0A1Y2KZA9_9PROT|nr:rhodanese-like domain-containing protein [Thalassospira mesophila]OSQ37768.1 sulfurtransferase [Thalassospira mesophila]
MVREISCEDVARMIKTSAPLTVIDVREAWEVEICAINGAVHIPLGDIAQRIDEIDTGKPVAVLCHHGVRSRHAAMFLMSRGVQDVFNIVGGIDLWAIDIAPEMARYE